MPPRSRGPPCRRTAELAPAVIAAPKFGIENISLPPEAGQAIDTGSRMDNRGEPRA